MRTTTLKIVQSDRPDDHAQLVKLLKNQPGVTDVSLLAAKHECSVLFDEQSTSIAQLQAALQAAGFASVVSQGAAATCCGSCGG